MALKESIRKAQKEKAYIRRYGLKLNTNTDKDIIDWLAAQPSMQGAIKAAVRAYMEQEEQKC
jgi:hypothetical protein